MLSFIMAILINTSHLIRNVTICAHKVVLKYLRMKLYFHYNFMNSCSHAQYSTIYSCGISVIAFMK